MPNTSRRVFSCFLIFILIFSLLTVPTMAFDHSETDAAYAALFPVPDSDWGTVDSLYSGYEIPDTVLKGKSIMFYGDSLFAGYGLDGYSQSWCGMLETQYGMKITCNAVSGSTFAKSSEYGYHPGGCYHPYCERTLPDEKFDVILVTGSGNDWYCEIPLGDDLASRDTSTLMGAMNVVIDRLQEAYPDALLLFMTSWNSTGKQNSLGLTTTDYNNTFLAVCEARGILCFEACDPAISGIDAGSETFRSEYFLTGTDYWHLNPIGNQHYLPTIVSWIEEMMLEHYVISGFYDVVPRNWYASAVAYAYESGLVNGVTTTSFAPEETMSRSMLVTVLYRAAGSPDVSELAHPFEDVPAGKYFSSAVLWGYNSGLIKGVDETHFSPDANVTRQQVATFLYRFSQAQDSDHTPGDLSQFTDSGEIGTFAKDAVSWAVGADILHGMGNGILAPKASATRAQTVMLLANYFSTLPTT